MSTPKLYWLNTDEGPKGPYATEQLSGMWERGDVVASQLLCEDGSDEWFPVTKLVESLKVADADRKYRSVAYRVMALLFGSLGVHDFYGEETGPGILKIVLTAGAIVFWNLGFFGGAWALSGIVGLWIIIDLIKGPPTR